MEVPILAPQGYWEVHNVNGNRILERMFWLEDLEFNLSAWFHSMAAEDTWNMPKPQSQLLSLSCFPLVCCQDHQFLTVQCFASILGEENYSTGSESPLWKSFVSTPNPSCGSAYSGLYSSKTSSPAFSLLSPSLLTSPQKTEQVRGHRVALGLTGRNPPWGGSQF